MPGAAGYVIDASIATKWIVEEEGSEAALALQDQDMIAPALLRIETANVLHTLVRKSVVSVDVARGLYQFLQSAPVMIADHDDDLERRALDLALELDHPVYDCVYLALAERTGRVLITADQRFFRSLGAEPHASRARLLT